MVKIVVCGNYNVSTREGKKPFDSWLGSLDLCDCERVTFRLDRLEMGNFGDWIRINSDLFELRLSFGLGYRIYCCMIQGEIILLWGGDKSSQQQ